MWIRIVRWGQRIYGVGLAADRWNGGRSIPEVMKDRLAGRRRRFGMSYPDILRYQIFTDFNPHEEGGGHPCTQETWKGHDVWPPGGSLRHIGGTGMVGWGTRNALRMSVRISVMTCHNRDDQHHPDRQDAHAGVSCEFYHESNSTKLNFQLQDPKSSQMHLRS